MSDDLRDRSVALSRSENIKSIWNFKNLHICLVYLMLPTSVMLENVIEYF